jgi:hypothetical protein
MTKGNPRCPLCDGRGGVFRHGRWHKCECTRMTPAKRAIQRKMYESPGHEYRDFRERDQERREST